MTEKVASPKKTKSPAKAKKPKTAPTHPKVSEMVNEAISSLKERGGTSLHAIKKYIASNYKVDVERLSPFIRKYLKTAVASGGLVQTKGKGASGSFRMKSSAPSDKAKSSISPKKAAAKPKAASTPKKAAKPKKAPQKSKPKKSPVKKAKPAAKTAAKKAKPIKVAVKKPAKSSPKKKAAAKKGKK